MSASLRSSSSLLHSSAKSTRLLLLSSSYLSLCRDYVCVRSSAQRSYGRKTHACCPPPLTATPPPPPPPVLKPPPPTIRPSMGFDNKQFPTLTRIVPTTGGQSSHDNYLSTLVNSPPGYLFFPPTLPPPPPPPFLSCIWSAMPMSKQGGRSNTLLTGHHARVGLGASSSSSNVREIPTRVGGSG